MSTNLSGNTLTLGSTSLDEETLKKIINSFYIPDNCKAGDTVILEGIECLCVATGVTIQGSNLTRIAIDKNHDLGYYQNYIGDIQDGNRIRERKYWRWGGYGIQIANAPTGVGYGLNNTINCLANTAAYTSGSSSDNNTYPLIWIGVNDFRSSHSDKWFVPSAMELQDYIYPHISSLSFDTTTGGSPEESAYWSSSENEYDSNRSYLMNFSFGFYSGFDKFGICGVRLCRAF